VLSGSGGARRGRREVMVGSRLVRKMPSMSDSNEAKLLSPEGQRTMQTVIDGYERLIAMILEPDKRKG
jgi:hypothetical protein